MPRGRRGDGEAVVVLSEVAADIVAAEDEARFRDLMQAHHYLGAVPGMGETMRYRIGRNKAYLHQYFSRRMPRALSHQDSEALGKLLDRDPEEFRHAELPAPKPWTGKRRRTPAAGPALATVSEVEVEASAGPGAFAEEFVQERARWRLPEVMVRHEGHADPDALRILRVRGTRWGRSCARATASSSTPRGGSP